MSFYLEKIRQTYYFRLRVPKDILPHLGTRQLRKSLRTKSHADAKTLVRGHLHAAEKLFVAIRSGMLTLEQIREIATEFKNRFLTNLSDARRRHGKAVYLPPDLRNQVRRGELQLAPKAENEAIIRFNEAEREKFSEWIQTNNFKNVQPLAESLLRKKSLPESQPEMDIRYLCEYLLKSKIEVCNTIIERMKGNYSNGFDGVGALAPSPHIPASPIPAATPPSVPKTLSELFETYKQVKEGKGSWASTTKEKNEASFSTIIDILGDPPLSDFKDEALSLKLLQNLRIYPRNKNKLHQFAGKRYSPAMAKQAGFKPLGEETVKFTMGLMSSLLRYANKNPEKWGLSVNLAEGLVAKDRRKPSEIRPEYTREDIEGLFTALAKVRKAVEPERYWVPLIGLYSGARLNEICQLRTEDISEDEGIPVVNIRHDLAMQQQTKTKESRAFPIHPTLVKLGFLDHVAKMRAEGQDRLWPNLRIYKGKWEKDMSKWFNRTFKPKFTSDEKKVFHSFRHSFINWFKQNTLKGSESIENLSIMKSMVGHLENADRGILEQIGGISLDRYGKAYPTSAQLKLLKQLDYGVNLNLLKR